MTNVGATRRTPKTYEPESVLVIACSTLALYNAFELLGLIFMTFKKRKGLYFWSISLSSFGAIPYCIGWMIVYFNLTHEWIGMIIDSIGWVLLVSGQSVVLYSRLHLVVNDQRILRAVLSMVIFNAVTWHISITILLFGSSYTIGETKRGFSSAFNVLEKVQMTCFCIQEFIISGLYIWKTADILRTAFGSKRRFMWHLCGINILIVMMDIGLLVLEYKNYFVWQQGIKVVIYTIKLKLEFAVLGQLIDFVQHRGNTNSGSATKSNTGGFMELTGSRTRTAAKRSHASAMPGAIHMKDIQPSDVASSRITAPQDREHNEIIVTTKIDVESCTLDARHNDSTEHLYETVIRQVSRS
ncbi:hypothetical protein EDB81DRAFT_658433 [Dactylonectria macrodidyma]|uniref:DUF7703 domain-containing protein n=1 Tax=Dactylonectria macrodidyma TaxID=307937 RepID=A0A9P9E9S1_9HYPO|nr:hypothetical protein EDB81DRAFT_658433 [Dactylonectria macrodidyma]